MQLEESVGDDYRLEGCTTECASSGCNPRSVCAIDGTVAAESCSSQPVPCACCCHQQGLRIKRHSFSFEHTFSITASFLPAFLPSLHPSFHPPHARLRDMKTEVLGQLAAVSGVVVRTSEVQVHAGGEGGGEGGGGAREGRTTRLERDLTRVPVSWSVSQSLGRHGLRNAHSGWLLPPYLQSALCRD